MPLIHNVRQGSDEWEALRRGKPTASQFDKIITPLGKASAQWEVYANKCIAELILKRRIDDAMASSGAMERGHYLEDEAMRYYEAQTGFDTKLVGFVTTDDGRVGCSPDRLVGDDGLLELKCPLPHTQIGYLLKGGIEDKYKPQLQGQLFVTGRQWVDILAYDPDFPDHVIMRVEREAAYLACLETLLQRFNDYVHTSVLTLAEKWKGINRVPDALEDFLGMTDDVPEIRNAQTLLAG